MSKARTPNQKKIYNELDSRLNKYVAIIERIYDSLSLEAAKLAVSVDYTSGSEKPFSFADYPEIKKQVEELQAQFVHEIHSVIYRGASDEWKNSNEAQDLLANKVLKAYNAQIDKEKYKIYYQVNSDALKAFQSRKDKGFDVSAKLWKQSTVYTKELEAAISCAIQKGTSAVTLSKQISKYLLDFPLLQKEYKDLFGSAEHIQDCEYRSIRLARTEINMAYRSAEQLRWSQMDFVVGYEVKRSGQPFSCSVCEALTGKYPKDFKFTGWHPSCRCYVIPILKTDDEFWAWNGRSGPTTDSVNEVKETPLGFRNWVSANQERIDEANARGTLPYFLRDNRGYLEKVSQN